jgi:parallel beta-helix repeat protein
MKHAVLALTLFILPASLFAQGPLTPPGPPGPTMLTLNQVEPRTPITNLPYSITVPGSYYVTTNLTGVSAFSGITILTNDVTIDLSGFTLEGVLGSGPAISVPGPERNLAVRNGALDGWGVRGTNAYNSLFEGLRESNSGGPGLLAGSNCIVSACSVSANYSVGIGVGNNCAVNACTVSGTSGFGILASNNCVVANCTAFGNTLYGIDGVAGTVIRSCACYQNGAGISVGNNCAVKDCTASDNSGDGIDAVNNCTVIDCSASANGVEFNNGISVVNNCTVKDCIASGNDFGITVNGNDCLIVGNTFSSNTYYGVEIIGVRNRVDGNTLGNNGEVGIDLGSGINVHNVIIRNSASNNGSFNYSGYAGNSDYGPTGTPTTATSPWANF